MNRFLLTLIALAAAMIPSRSAHAYKVLYEKQSRYHYIRVIESGTVRTLTFRRKGYDRNQSRMDMSDPLRPALPYYPLMFAGYLFVPEPKRILVVGMGAGVLSHLSAHYFPEAQVDSIELDPDVVDVAKRFFGFEEGERQRVFIRDARVQVKTFQGEGATYDIIMLDAFSGGYVPFHLTTKEFFQECRSILSPAGALVVNLKPGWVIYQYQRRTLVAVFPEQYPFGGASGDQIVVALPSSKQASKETFLAAAKNLQQKRRFSFHLADVVAQFDVGPDFAATGPILTDDHSPADVLRQQLENPYGKPVTHTSPLGRISAWVSTHRLPIICAALIVILIAVILRRRQRNVSAR